MATYLTPGVYVEQVPSAIQPIAGVGTSTAAFIGIFPTPITGEIVGTGDGQTTIFPLARYPVQTTNYEVDVKPDGGSEAKSDATIDNAPLLQRAIVTFKQAPQKDAQITA